MNNLFRTICPVNVMAILFIAPALFSPQSAMADPLFGGANANPRSGRFADCHSRTIASTTFNMGM